MTERGNGKGKMDDGEWKGEKGKRGKGNKGRREEGMLGRLNPKSEIRNPK